MSSSVYRALSKDKKIRAFAIECKDIVKHAKEIHHDSPCATVTLGKLLISGLMLSQMLKSIDDKLTLQLLGDGVMKHCIVTSTFDGTCRGYCSNPSIMIPKNRYGIYPLTKSIGNGSLTIIKDMGLKEPFVSSIEIDSDDLSLLLEEYFTRSDQIDTYISLDVRCSNDGEVINASGILLQLMPFTDDKTKEELEKRFDRHMLLNDRPDKILVENGFDITDEVDASWRCNCSYERGIEVLSTLKKEDLQEMIDEDENTIMTCDFCGKSYQYSKDVLKEILSKKI